jgi:hypothetical protein
MSIAKGLFGVLALGALATATWAVPPGPVAGTYRSEDGDMYEGRSSRSWPSGGGDLQVGNALNSASFDGATLGTQWQITCPQVCAAPILIFNGLNGQGTGQQIWQLIYCGGSLFLDGSPQWGWSGGLSEYEAVISSMSVIMTLQFVQNVVVGGVTNVNFQGDFVGFSDCFEMLISSEHDVGSTNNGSLPSDYPGFVNGVTCTPGPSEGSWWEFDGITLTIIGECLVPTKEATWGEVKARFRR